MSLTDAVNAATKAMEAHVKANSLPISDSPWGTGVSYAFNPSMEACMEVALTAALPFLEVPVHVMTGCVDAEQYATIHNLGFEAAMAQHCAPEGRESDAQDWFEDKLDQAAADGIRDAVKAFNEQADIPTVAQWTMIRFLLGHADKIHAPTEQEPTDG
jgi:hypothetical protein